VGKSLDVPMVMLVRVSAMDTFAAIMKRAAMPANRNRFMRYLQGLNVIDIVPRLPQITYFIWGMRN